VHIYEIIINKFMTETQFMNETQIK
jgi:hypothetical protein